MLILGGLGIVHINSQLVTAVPVVQMECGCRGFSCAQIQAPTQDVMMEQHHALVESNLQLCPALICHQ